MEEGNSRRSERGRYLILIAALLAVGIILALFASNESSITGQVTLQKLSTYNESFGEQISENRELAFAPAVSGKLQSFRVSGSVGVNGSAKIYLVDGSDRYLAFDSHLLEYAPENLKQFGNAEFSSPELNSTGSDKMISPALKYNENSNFDTDDDGVEKTDGVIDFSVAPSTFNWGVDEENLCTRWQVYNYDSSESEIVCVGSEQCCLYAGHESLGGSWKNTFYLNYGKYGAGKRNFVRAQVVYFDYNASVDNPYVDFTFSSWAELRAVFTDDVVDFNDVCLETCALDLSSSVYSLNVEVDNTTLSLDSAKYGILEVLKNHAPVFAEIPDIRIVKNSTYALKLNVSEPDNDSYTLSYSSTDGNVTVEITNLTATITPAVGYTGTSYLTFLANDSESIGLSNYIKVDVFEEVDLSRRALIDNITQGFAVVGKPVRWTRRIELNESVSNLKLNISDDAFNISIKSGGEELTDKVTVVDKGVEKNATEYDRAKRLELIEREIDRLNELKRAHISDKEKLKELNLKLGNLQGERNRLTGFAIFELNGKGLLTRLFEWLSGDITGAVVAETPANDSGVEVIVQEAVSEIIVEYETPAPVSDEVKVSDSRKNISVSSSEHYENILAFTSIPELPREAIRLYQIVNGTRIQVDIYSFMDNDADGKIDEIYWIVPSLSKKDYEVDLQILTVQSYPIVGGNWTVDFTTIGRADLVITAVNGTAYDIDILPLGIMCGDTNKNYQYNGTSLKINNYQCDNITSYHTVKVLKAGHHTQEFRFGNVTDYAFNLAEQGTPVINMTDHPYNTTNANITAWNISSVNATKNIWNWFVNNQSFSIVNMPFENHTGDEFSEALDYSVNNNGTVMNNTIYNSTGGHDGRGAYVFNGTSNYINLGNDTPFQINGDITLSAWIKTNTNPEGGLSQTIISKWWDGTTRTYSLHIKDGFAYFSTGTTDDVTGANQVQGATMLNGTGWHHIAAVYNGSRNAIFVDGILHNSTAQTGRILNNTADLIIGMQPRKPSPTTNLLFPFNGTIDEVMVFNRSLSTQEIRALYENKTNLIVSPELTAGQTWWANVTPNDGVDNGDSKKSNEITIQAALNNYPPTHSTPILNATDHPSNTSSANLTVYNQSTSDLDGNSVKNIYNWFVDNQSIAVLNMPFENHTGDESLQAVDYSGYGNNGSVGGAVYNSTGGHDGKGAYQFNSTKNIIIPNNLNINLTSGYTISFWARTFGDIISYRGLIVRRSSTSASNASWEFNVNNVNIPYFCVHKDDLGDAVCATPSGGMTLNQWYYIVGVFNQSSVSIYVNGTLQNNNSYTGSIYYSNAPISIGGNTNTNFFNGSIDDVMIFNRSLSAAQIKALYENKTNLIVSQELTAGQTWWANVTPNDGIEDGNSLKSNEITIGAFSNSKPTQTAPIINATDHPSNSTSANLTVYNQSTSDLDGNNVKNIYNWFVDNQSIAVLNMPFENHTGDESLQAVDYSGYGFNSSINGSLYNSTGGYDGRGAYQFNGTTNFISLPKGVNVSSADFTFLLRFKSSEVSKTQYLISFASLTDDVPIVEIYTKNAVAGEFCGFVRYNDGTGPTSICTGVDDGATNGKWHTGALTKRGIEYTTYLDGQKLANKSSVVNQTSLSSFNIGRLNRLSGASGFFNGTIDEVMIFNRSLSPEQIRAIYLNQSNVLVQNETATGETWWINVTPNDGIEDGNSLKSNEITIGRQDPPTHTAPIINMTDYPTNSSSANITAYNQSTSDINGDSVKNIYNWFVDNQSIAVLNMPFENHTGDEALQVVDYSGYGFNGSINGSLYNSTSGHDGKGAYKFDGASTYINLTNRPSLTFTTQDFTISAWIYPVNLSNHLQIFSKGQYNAEGIYFATNADNKNLDFRTNQNSATQLTNSTGNSMSEANRWYHVAVTRDGSVATIYINGVNSTNFSASHINPASSSKSAMIGAYFDAVTQPFNGTIDDVMIFNRSLSSAEVKALYENKTNLIVSQELVTGQTWWANVTPNDGIEDGNSLKSNEITIGAFSNSKPTQTAPLINMTDFPLNSTSANLTAYNQSTTDTDGNNVKNIYNWFVNNQSFAVLNMPFEANGGSENSSTQDYSGYNNPGDVNATWNSTGGYDGKGAYFFDGTHSDHINIANSGSINFSASNRMTITAWINPNIKPRVNEIVIASGNYNGGVQSFYFAISNRTAAFGTTGLGFGYYDGSAWHSTATGDYGINTWQFVAGEYNGTHFSIYINGTLKNSTAWTGNLLSNAMSKTIGSYNSSGLYYYNWSGYIDDVMFFNRSLSAQEIKSVYTNKTNVIVSQELTAGQTWWANVTPNDGIEDGNSLKSNEITIQANAAPTHSTPILNATDFPTNSSSANLTVYNQSTSDVNEDKIKNIYNWFVNNESIAVLNMPFEANGGNEALQATDYSGYGNNGSVNGSSFTSTGGYDGKGAYIFDGKDDYMELPRNIVENLTNQITVEAWINQRGFDAGKNYEGVISKAAAVSTNMSFLIDLYDASQGCSGPSCIRFVMSTTGINSASAVFSGASFNTWYHVAGVYNGTNASIYINGTLVAVSAGITGDLHKNTNRTLIGAIYDTNNLNFRFNGTIDEIRIYNRSLSPDEIRAHYQNKTNLIVSQELAAGQVWYANVTPNDGYSDGNSLKSNEITIGAFANSKPTQTAPIINATDHPTNGTGANLTAYNQSTTDTDGNNVKNIYNWFRNGTSIAKLNMPFQANGGNNATDYSGNNNKVVVTNAVWNTTGGFDGKGAYYFDGATTRIEVLDNASVNTAQPITVELRVMPEGSLAGYRDLIGKGRTDPTNNLYLTLASGKVQNYNSITSTAELQLGKWYHIVYTADSVTESIYINGKLNVSEPTQYLGNEAGNLTLGMSPQGPATGEFYQGYIDEVRVYNYSMSSGQVRALYFNRTDVIDSSETRAGENWSVNITPNDGFEDGNSLGSNIMVIQNTPPTHATPILNTTDHPFNRTTANLTVYNQSTSDADGDKIKNIYNWFVDNKSIAVVNLPFEGGSASGTNSASGYTQDYSGYNNSGVVINATWNATGGFDGKGAYLLNSSSYIVLFDKNSLSPNSGNWSLSMRLKTSVGVGNLFNHRSNSGNNNGHQISITSAVPEITYTMDWGVPLTQTQFSGTILDDKWHNIIITLDRKGNQTIYVDGRKGNSTDISVNNATALNPGVNFILGTSQTLNSFINGSLDELMIFNRTLSESEIYAIYTNQTNVLTNDVAKGGEVWYANVTPNDGTADGNSLSSNQIAIQSTPPTHSTPILNATDNPSNTTLANLTAYNQSTSDAEGNSVRNVYNWFVNNVSYAMINSPLEASPLLPAWVQDYSGNNYSGIGSNVTWNSTGGYGGGGALKFNDSNNQIDYGDIDINRGNFTVMARIFQEFSESGGEHHIISKSGGGVSSGSFALTLYNGQPQWYVWIGGTRYSKAAGSISLRRWTHLAGVYNGTHLAVYQNGAQQGTATAITGLVTASTDKITVGYGSSQQDWVGYIDDIMILNRSLSSAEIRAVYNNQSYILQSQAKQVVGETWWANVTPNDGYSDGNSLKSNELTILNAVPTATNVKINTTDNLNRTNGTILGFFDYSDAEGNAQVRNETRWFINYTAITAYDNLTTLSETNSTQGYNFTFSARVFDGTDWSEWANSTTMLIVNYVPTHTAPILNATDSNQNLTTANLTAYNQSTFDLDNGVKNIYNWFVNNKSMAVLNLPFENHPNSASEALDYSGYNNNMTVVGLTFNSTGGYDGRGAYEFPGTGYMAINATNGNLSALNNITFLAWIKSYDLVGALPIAYRFGGPDYIFRTNAQKLDLYWGVDVGQAQTGNVITSSSKWYQVGFSRPNAQGNSNVKIYVNGVNVSLTTYGAPANITDNRNALWIGRYGTGMFNGKIDEVMLFNRTLSPEEVLAIYNNQSSIMQSFETRVGETWSVNVTPNDGVADGISLKSNDVNVIGDTTPPASSAITVNNTAPLIGMNIFLNWTVSDNMGLNRTWLQIQNGTVSYNITPIAVGGLEANANYTYPVLDVRGTTLNFTVFVNDSANNFASSAVLQVAVANTAPNASSLKINTSDNLNRTNGTIFGFFGISDADNDAMTRNQTMWFINFTYNASYDNLTILNETNSTKGYNFTFSARVYDGYNWSEWTNSTTMTIANSPPEHNNPIMNATNPNNTTDANLTVYNQSTRDLDGDGAKNIYNWIVDNKSIAILNMPFLPNAGDASLQVVDYSGYGNNGSVSGAVWNTTGGYGGSGGYEFYGTNTNITVKNNGSLNPPNHLSISVWFKYRELKNNNFLFAKYDGTNVQYSLNGYSHGGLAFSLGKSSGGSSGINSDARPSTLGRWHHVVATFNSSHQIALYIDGTLDNTAAFQWNMSTTNAGPLVIGGYAGTPLYGFNGTISDLRIYNATLSFEEVKAIFSNRSDVIAQEETTAGQTWWVNVTPNDGVEDGNSLKSNELTIRGYTDINMTSPLNAATKALANVTFNYEINQSHITDCSLYINRTGQFSALQNATNPGIGVKNFTLVMRNGKYVWNVWCNTTTNDASYSGTNFTLTVDVPNIGVSYSTATMGNNSNVSRNWVFVNLSVTATDLANVSYNLFNSTRLLINTSFRDESTKFLNFTNLAENTVYYYNVTVEDYAGNKNSTETRIISLDTLTPNVTLYSPMPVNWTSGGPSVIFNWSVRDNMDLSLECNTTIDGISNQTFFNANNSFGSVPYNLSGGLHTLAVSCYDDAGNINSSDSRSYASAIINVSAPRFDAVFKQNESVTITISVLEGTGFIGNVTLYIYNTTYQATSVSPSQWSLGYTVANITPQKINITATAYNNTLGGVLNFTSAIRFKVSKEGSIAAPLYTAFCSNETYTTNSSNITIANIVDMDNLLESISINITSPDGGIFNPVQSRNSSDSNMINIVNFTYTANSTGMHNMTVIAMDISNQTVNKQEVFYVSNTSRAVNITNAGFDSISLKDVCLGNTIHQNPTSISIPNISAYDVVAQIPKITLTARNSTLGQGNITINFTQRTTESAPPSGQRRIDMFDLNLNNTYNNVTILFNYSSFSHTLTHESNLKFYRCENETNCAFEQQNMTLNSSVKTITMNLPALSRYILTEPALTTPELTKSPTINRINVSRLYTAVNETINITLDINYTLGIDNLTVTLNGTTLTSISSSNNSNNMRYSYNYTPASIGTYVISVLIIDSNTFNATSTKSFNSDYRQSFTIDAPGAQTITVYDLSNNNTVGQGAPLAINDPPGKYNIEIVINKTRVMVINASLNSTVSSVFNLTDRAESITAPTDRINIDQFEANTSIGFENVLFYYNYTNLTSSITNEGNLEVFRCTSSGNCTWSEINSEVNTLANILSFNVSSFSLFDVVESIRTQNTIETVIEPGGGGGTRTIIKKEPALVQLEINTAPVVTLGPKETITVPIILKNKGQFNLTGIYLESNPKDPSVSAVLGKNSFERIDIGETEKTSVTLSSFDLYNGTEVILKGTVQEPAIEDTLAIIIRPTILYMETDESRAVEKLKFVGDMFEKNPECLELREMLELANSEIKNGNYKKATDILDKTLNVCRDLISYRKESKAPFLSPAYIWVYQAINAILLMFISVDFYFNHSDGLKKKTRKMWERIRKRKH
ncbi:LamG domain-containing protein [Candidatus Woesearchaeota archaeon]|nr:LamG domain-containing protein [Candidatus Woesearchaeota archaeon]